MTADVNLPVPAFASPMTRGLKRDGPAGARPEHRPCIRFPDDEGTETEAPTPYPVHPARPAFASPMTRGLKPHLRFGLCRGIGPAFASPMTRGLKQQSRRCMTRRTSPAFASPMTRGLKPGGMGTGRGACRAACIRFPDDEGTETRISRLRSSDRSRSCIRFPDDEGTETSDRVSRGEQVAALHSLPR